MLGFKLVDEGIVNQYGTKYELNKKYYLNGEVKYSKNGFHFSTYPENTLRFASINRPEVYTIVEVEASGIIECGDDYQTNEAYGFSGMYASSEMIILREIPREEIFQIILNSNNPKRIQTYIQLACLKKEEISQIRDKYDDFYTNAYIDYYQFKDEKAFYKSDEFFLKKKLK